MRSFLWKSPTAPSSARGPAVHWARHMRTALVLLFSGLALAAPTTTRRAVIAAIRGRDVPRRQAHGVAVRRRTQRVERDARERHDAAWSEPARLLTIRGTVRNLVFSPDGKRLAFENPRAGNTKATAKDTWAFIAVYDIAARRISYVDPQFGVDSRSEVVGRRHADFVHAQTRPTARRIFDEAGAARCARGRRRRRDRARATRWRRCSHCRSSTRRRHPATAGRSPTPLAKACIAPSTFCVSASPRARS